MDEAEKLAKELKQSIEKLIKLNEMALLKVSNEHGDLVKKAFDDNKKLLDAIDKRDLDLITKIAKDYAGTNPN
jgi:DNA-binding GntR family transcriptional regulator